MSDFANLIANAVNPTMSREDRDRVYDIARQAVLRIYGDVRPLTANPQVAFQLHLIEETIRDIETEISKYIAFERLRLAGEAQEASFSGRRNARARNGPEAREGGAQPARPGRHRRRSKSEETDDGEAALEEDVHDRADRTGIAEDGSRPAHVKRVSGPKQADRQTQTEQATGQGSDTTARDGEQAGKARRREERTRVKDPARPPAKTRSDAESA